MVVQLLEYNPLPDRSLLSHKPELITPGSLAKFPHGVIAKEGEKREFAAINKQ